MEDKQRPRFDQETGQRIIYEDEINPEQIGQEQVPMQGQPIETDLEADQQSKRRKGCLITFMIILIVAGLASIIAYARYSDEKSDVVEYNESDVESFYDKVGIDNEDYLPSVEKILIGDINPSGEIKVNDSFSSAEITAAIQDAAGENDYFEDVNVRFIDDGQVEVFATVSDEINDLYEIAPDLESFDFILEKLEGQKVYYVADVEYNEDGFGLNVDKLKVGMFSIPTAMINSYDETIETLLNNAVDNISGFEIESLEINDDNLDFNGSIPEKL